MFGRSVIRVVDLDARVQRRARAREDLEGLAVGLVWAVFSWRVELVALALLMGTDRAVASLLGEVAAAVVVLVLVAGVVAWRPARKEVSRVLTAMRLRRAWARAAIDAGVAAGPFRSPGVRCVGRIPAGDRLRVRVRRGQSVPMLEARREELAACMRVRDVRVRRDPKDAAEADVVLVRRDPFENVAPMPWPCADATELSLWEPIPVGIDELGETVAIDLAERNVLLGGEPGAGKSVALSTLIAAAALDPHTRVWLLDGKIVELAAWAPVAERAVGPEGEDALAVLWELREVMDARYRELLARGLRKLRRDEGLPCTWSSSMSSPSTSRSRTKRSARSSPSCCAISWPVGVRPASSCAPRPRSLALTSSPQRCATFSASGSRSDAPRRRPPTRF
jgi:hypothetical protein